MSLNRWRIFIRNSLLERVPENDFASLTTILHEQHYLKGRKIARIVIDCRTAPCSYTDPIILRYLRCLIFNNHVSIVDVLSTVLEDWTVDGGRKQERNQDDTSAALGADALIVQELAVISATRQQSEGFDARACFLGCSKLLLAIVPQVGKSNGSRDGETVSVDPALSLAEAICLLFATVSATDAGLASLLDEKDKGTPSS